MPSYSSWHPPPKVLENHPLSSLVRSQTMGMLCCSMEISSCPDPRSFHSQPLTTAAGRATSGIHMCPLHCQHFYFRRKNWNSQGQCDSSMSHTEKVTKGLYSVVVSLAHNSLVQRSDIDALTGHLSWSLQRTPITLIFT